METRWCPRRYPRWRWITYQREIEWEDTFLFSAISIMMRPSCVLVLLFECQMLICHSCLEVDLQLQDSLPMDICLPFLSNEFSDEE